MTSPPRPRLTPELSARFAAIVGDRYAVTDAGAIAPYLVEDRNLYEGSSPLVLQPGSTAQVSAICRLASATNTALVAQGGNTGLVGGQIPRDGEIVLSLRRLNRIRDVDPVSNTLTAEAGVILADAQRAATQAARLFPLSLASEGSCTIGGTLSTNAGGIAALAYGVARDLVLGLEVVLADGRIVHGLSKLKKDNTGYSLRNLFVGAEGTLGIITAATLKLFPQPRSVETAFAAVESPSAALALLELAQRTAAANLTSFELISHAALDFALRHGASTPAPLAAAHRWYVLLEIASPRDDARDTIEAILADGLAGGIVGDAAVAANLEQRARFWRLRASISPAQKPEGGSIKHDVSLPVASVPEFLAEADAAVTRLIPGARPVAFGHLGDGSLHYNVSQPAGADRAGFLARRADVNAGVYAIVARLGGSISAEHGIGALRRDDLATFKDPAALDVMRAIKAALDPLEILNPGKVLPGG